MVERFFNNLMLKLYCFLYSQLVKRHVITSNFEYDPDFWGYLV